MIKEWFLFYFMKAITNGVWWVSTIREKCFKASFFRGTEKREFVSTLFHVFLFCISDRPLPSKFSLKRFESLLTTFITQPFVLGGENNHVVEVEYIRGEKSAEFSLRFSVYKPNC